MAETESICPRTAYCLILYRNFDDGKKTMVSEVPVDEANLEGFIRTYKSPSVSELTPDTYREFFTKDSDFMVLLCQELRCDEAKDIFSRFAIRNRNQMRFIFGFSETPIGAHFMRFLDIKSEDELPALRILKIRGREVLKHRPDSDENVFSSFIENKIMPKQAPDDSNRDSNREQKMEQKLRSIRKRKGYGSASNRRRFSRGCLGGAGRVRAPSRGRAGRGGRRGGAGRRRPRSEGNRPVFGEAAQ